MIQILLVCNTGMSTSMLVKKMKDVAKEESIEANIWAVGDIASIQEALKADIVCLSPQVHYLLERMNERVKQEKPVMIMDSKAYDTMDGRKILLDAIQQVHTYFNF